MNEFVQLLVQAAPVTDGVGDPSIWVTVLNQTPLAAICVVLAFVVRYLYKGKETLHTDLFALEKEHAATLEEMARLMHEVNLVNMEKSFTASQRWQDTIDGTINNIEDGMLKRFEMHLQSEERSLEKINSCLLNIDVLLQGLKERTGVKISDQIKDIQTKIDKMKEMLERRRDNIREDHRRSRDELVQTVVQQVDTSHAPLVDGINELKGKVDELLG